MNDAALLNPLIMAAPDDFPVTDQNRADGNTPSREPFFRLFDSRLKEMVHETIFEAYKAPATKSPT